MDGISAALGAGIAALLIALAKGVERYSAHKARHSKTSFQQALERQHAVYPILYGLKRETGAMSVMIGRSENGGGVPHPGRNIYSSIAFEVTDTESVRASWQRQLCDQQYAEMLYRVVTQGRTCFDVRDMTDGSLKDVYSVRGVAYSEMYLLLQTDIALFYLILHFKKVPLLATADSKNRRHGELIAKAARDKFLARHSSAYKEMVRSVRNELRDLLNFGRAE